MTIVKVASFIHVTILDLANNEKWSLLLLYISSVDNIQNDQFHFLVDYKNNLDNAFLLMGDFNSVLHSWEKYGGNGLINAQVRLFRDFVNTMVVVDFNFKG